MPDPVDQRTIAALLQASADAEICSDAPLEKLGDGASNRRRCVKALVGVSASLAALAVVAAAFAGSRAPAASGVVGQRVADTKGAISMQEDSVHGAADLLAGAEEEEPTSTTSMVDNSTTIVSREEDTGCGSWRRIAFHEAITTLNEEECLKLCYEQPGCKYANFQSAHPGTGEAGDYCNPNYALHIGSCYTFANDCVKAKNPCWVLLEPKPEDLTPGAFMLVKTAMGCSNWRSATIGDVEMVLNHYECSWMCQMAEGCVQFNYQEEDCKGNAHHCKEQVGKGACYLFSKPCVEETNEFWDLYGMLQSVNDTEDDGSEATTTITTDTQHVSPLPGP